MQFSRNRKVILVLVIAGLVFVYLRLISHHYYRLTWARCAAGATNPQCGTWFQQALLEALLVVLVAVAAWIWWKPPEST
jgi:hypothetical protein